MQKSLFVYRHGETDFNVQRIVQGKGVNTNLNMRGFMQARAFYEFYKSHSFDLIITSSLKRSQQTAWPFIQTGQAPWEALDYFDEISWGDQEGMKGTPESIQIYKDTIESWKNNQLDASLPNGESAKQLFERLHAGIDWILARPEKKILLCMHGRSMRGLVAALQKQHPKYMEEYMHYNTGLYTFDIKNNEASLVLRNNIDHLSSDLV